jgi:hypothetical protein
MDRVTTSFALCLVAATALGCDDGAAWAPLATSQRFVADMTADGDFVYWVTGDGAVRRVSIDGGAVETIVADLTNPSHVAVDGTHVYWAASGGVIARAPKAGGDVEQLAGDEQDTVALRVDDANVYWARKSGPIMSKPKTGEPPVTLAIDPSHPFSLAQGGATLFWSAGQVDDGAVRDVAIAGGAVNDFDHPLSPRILAANGAYVCWASLDRDALEKDPLSSAQTLSRAALGAADAHVLARDLGEVTALIADETHVYFATLDGKLNAVPVEGGDVTTFASGAGGKTSLAVDATSVYWAHEKGDAVFVYPKQ